MNDLMELFKRFVEAQEQMAQAAMTRAQVTAKTEPVTQAKRGRPSKKQAEETEIPQEAMEEVDAAAKAAAAQATKEAEAQQQARVTAEKDESANAVVDSNPDTSPVYAEIRNVFSAVAAHSVDTRNQLKGLLVKFGGEGARTAQDVAPEKWVELLEAARVIHAGIQQETDAGLA